jgi:oligoendopeptidase F
VLDDEKIINFRYLERDEKLLTENIAMSERIDWHDLMTATFGAMNWDLSTYFPKFGGPEHLTFTNKLERDILALCDKSQELEALSEDNQEEWEMALLRYEELSARFSHVASYIGCLSSCDSANEEYRKEEGRLSVLGAEFQKLWVEFMRAVRTVDDEVFATFCAREKLQSASYFIERLREDAAFSMDSNLEALAADLGTDGITAWGRLYDTLSGNLNFTMEFPDGERKTLPMSQRRSLVSDADRRIREGAFRAGNEAWAGVADIAASALNHIAGTRHTLNDRRGIEHFLDVALFQAGISRKTLDAMMEAIEGNWELPRSFLQSKSNALGLDKISWFDLEAGLPTANDSRLTWEQGKQMTDQAFGKAYPDLARYFNQVLANKWVEWEPRTGKRPGAYCTGSELSNETRVFMTFQGSLGDVSTLAHEVGHAFHAHIMRGIRVLSRQYPMTLAESASTFAELLLTDGLLAEESITDQQRATLLNKIVNDGSIFLLDIPVRFQFEKKFYEERRDGEVSVSRLNQLMTETQRHVFGDSLAEGGEDPYFWASKLHFFITGVTFYNFPYTFGFLLSRGLYSLFKKEGPAFLPKYESFLKLSGSDWAHKVAQTSLGRDLESPEFWVEAINSLKEPFEQLQTLMPSLYPDRSWG